VTGEDKEVHQDPSTTGRAEVKELSASTVRFHIARLRGLPIIPPGTFRRLWRNQEAIGKAFSSRLVISNVLQDAFRPAIPPDVLRALRQNQAALRKFAAGLTQQLRAGTPPNWQFGDDWPMLSLIADVVEQDGIPLAWVPRSDIVLALVHAEGIEARRAILASGPRGRHPGGLHHVPRRHRRCRAGRVR
jgi:hypothetical protein